MRGSSGLELGVWKGRIFGKGGGLSEKEMRKERVSRMVNGLGRTGNASTGKKMFDMQEKA